MRTAVLTVMSAAPPGHGLLRLLRHWQQWLGFRPCVPRTYSRATSGCDQDSKPWSPLRPLMRSSKTFFMPAVSLCLPPKLLSPKAILSEWVEPYLLLRPFRGMEFWLVLTQLLCTTEGGAFNSLNIFLRSSRYLLFMILLSGLKHTSYLNSKHDCNTL